MSGDMLLKLEREAVKREEITWGTTYKHTSVDSAP